MRNSFIESNILEFIKLVAKTRLINSIKHEYSGKFLNCAIVVNKSTFLFVFGYVGTFPVFQG